MEVQDLNNIDIPEGINEPETQENKKLSINSSDVETNRSEIVVDYVFAYNVATKIMQESEDLEPRSVTGCRQRNEWQKWKEAIQS